MSLRATLIAAGLLIGVPIFPDWGIQITLSTAIGLVLPQRVIRPMNLLVLVIAPPAIVFERKLSHRPRLKHLIPRIMAGYLVTILIGAILIITGYLLPVE